jgi:DNA-binding MarR family transcriptional regulator
MNKKVYFLNMIQNLIDVATEAGKLEECTTKEGLEYLEALKVSDDKKDKPQFTDNGKLILSFMKGQSDKLNNMFKAKDIAEGIFVSSRSVSGAIRKLVTDGFVEKTGQDPIIYSLTTAGKEVTIE